MNRLIRAMRAIRVLALCGLFVWAFADTAGAAATAVRLACLGEFESFPAWYAHERQWDAAEGIAVELKVLPTGRLLVDNMRALDWNLAACGGVPAMLAMLRKDVYAVGVGTDEAAANGIYARPGSPLFTADKAEAGRLMRGGMILCPLGTSAHQILLAWLEGLGLREDDVVIVDTKPEEALAAFLGGMGDAVALWSPAAYEARRRGLREVANGKDCGLVQPTLIIAERRYADGHPQEVTAFLRGYLQAVAALESMPDREFAPLYRRFLKETAGREISVEEALAARAGPTQLTAERQRVLLGGERDGEALRGWLRNVIAFHQKTGALSSREAGELERLPLVTPRFLPSGTE